MSDALQNFIDGQDPTINADWLNKIDAFRNTLFQSALTALAAREAILVPNKNKIHGGDFATNPWQRGTTFTASPGNVYTADRWYYGNTASRAGRATVSRLNDFPQVSEAGILSPYCLQVACTTTDALAAGAAYGITQVIEGYDFLALARSPMTLSFWHKHSQTGTFCVCFKNYGSGGGAADRSYVAEYTQAVSNTWEKATITVPASPSGGTWDFTNGLGLNVSFSLGTGSTFQGAPNAWLTGNYIATANQTNVMGSTSNRFRIGLVQLEGGSVGTQFDALPYQQVLALCLRYFQRHGATGVDPEMMAIGTRVSDTLLDFYVQTSSPMRAAPTLTESTGSWANGSPGPTESAAFNMATGMYVVSTNPVITASFGGLDPLFSSGVFRLTGVGGVFDGTSGDSLQLFLGTSTYFDFSADF